MTEPVYVYNKGQGWVPAVPAPYDTRVIRGFKFAIEKRKPNIGEVFWFIRTKQTADDIFRMIKEDIYWSADEPDFNIWDTERDNCIRPNDVVWTVLYERT